ncbi:ESF1 -like protein ABT1-associated protein [Channa argus]|uniref:ESF1-like protein ABT1-associated protein n=1 Tax=Channa argus TaxID=215402 RepID=A0A6G1PD53_CHAAH|nr:ESF1 -like protein ABT1-associated protein [Channa argus]
MSSKKNQDGDERFLRVQKDPRFWEMPDRERKIKIDKRFQSMFHDERFKVRYTVDKRGRPINHTSTEDLKRFYKLADSEDEEDDDDKDPAKKKAEGKKKKTVKLGKEGKVLQSRGDKAKGGKPEQRVRAGEDEDEDDKHPQTEEEEEDGVDLGDSVSDSSEEEEEEDGEGDDDDDAEEEKKSDSVSRSDEEDESGLNSEEDSDSGPDLARGKGNIETSSDEEDDDDDDYVDAVLHREEEEIEHDWGELCKDAPRSDEVSARLAVCNMDWDRLKAKDLLALLNSFTPKGGAVLSVKIYPSEFGKQRLQTEEMQGPLELKALPDDSEDDTEEERVYREKMRDYQFKRLKYFYAVVECDSAATAAKIYEECDGFEYESSCSVLDLRFVPDDVKFDDEPKDVATDVNLGAYTPKVFTSSATATSKVQLTWDETDHERVTALNRKFNKDELLEMDFTAYLASSSDDEEDDDDGDDGDKAEDKDDEEQVMEEVKKPQQEEKKKKNSEEKISKYRELLKGIQDKEKKLQEDKDMEMEITWVPGLKETAERLVKKKMEGKDKLTPWEEYLQKKKEKKKQKKSQRKEAGGNEDLSDDELPADVDLSDPFFTDELGTTDRKGKEKRRKKKQQGEEERTAEEEEELEKQKAEMALLMDDDTDEAKHKHFNYDKIVEQQNLSKKKRKKLLKKSEEPLEDDDFQVNVQDPRFQAMFTSHLFNLDPSHPSYRKTKATESIQAEKQRRREREEQQRSKDVLSAQKAAAKRVEPVDDVQEATGQKEHDSDASTAKKPMDPSLSLLVKSIKSKTEQFQARKKPKLL